MAFGQCTAVDLPGHTLPVSDSRTFPGLMQLGDGDNLLVRGLPTVWVVSTTVVHAGTICINQVRRVPACTTTGTTTGTGINVGSGNRACGLDVLSSAMHHPV